MQYKNFIGNKLRELRIQKKYTVDDIKNFLATYEYPVSRKTIYRWENNEVIPDLRAVTILCDLYKITASNLMDIKQEGHAQTISKYETQFIFAFRTNKAYRKIINNILKKEDAKNANYWRKVKDLTKGE